MPIYDTGTGKIVYPESDVDLNNGLSNGMLQIKDEPKIHVYKVGNPNDVYMMPVENLPRAFQTGYAVESPVKREIREYIEVNSDAWGSLKTAAGEAANSLALSIPEIIMAHTSDPTEWAKLNGMREENSVGALTGDVAGSLASMFYGPTGPVGAVAGKIGVKLLSKRIMATVGKSMSEKMALKASKEILSAVGKKTGGNILARGAIASGKGVQSLAGGVARGVDEMLPAAGAHAYFGDYEAAGQSMMIGGLFGGALQVPIGLTKGAAKLMPKGKKLDDVVGEMQPGETPGQKAMIRSISTFTNMSDDQIRFTLNNGPAIANARQFGEIYDEFGLIREKTFRDIDNGIDDVRIAQEDLNAVRKNRSDVMSQVADGPNRALADKIAEDMAEVKSWYAFKGKEADDILAKNVPDYIIPRKPLEEAYTTEIKLLQKRAGVPNQEAAEMLKKSKRTLANIKEEMNGVGARQALRDIRAEIEKEAGKANPNTSFTHAMFGISEDFSNAIKDFDVTKQYSDLMDEMSTKMKATKEFTEAMQDEASRLNVGKTLAKREDKHSAADMKKKNLVDNWLVALNGINPNSKQAYKDLPMLQKEANDYLSDRKEMVRQGGRSGQDRFDKKHHSDELHRLAKSQLDLRRLTRESEKMAPLIGASSKTPMSEMKLRKYADDNKNIKLNEAFDLFIKKNDVPHLRDDLRFSLAAESLDKSKINGSRLVNLLGVMGAGGLGSFTGLGGIGATVGAVAGATLDKHAGKILKNIANSEKVKVLFNAENKLAKVSNAIEDIPNGSWFSKGTDKLKKTAKHSRTQVLRQAASATNAVMAENTAQQRKERGITDKTATEANVSEREFGLGVWKTLYYTYLSAEENPENIINKVDDDTAIIAQGSPELAAAVGKQMINANGYLAGEIPKPPAPDSPFIEKGEEWEPNDYDLDVFQQKVVVAQEPLTVIDALYAGEVTKGMVESLAAVYPNIMQGIQAKLIETMAENPDAMTYDRKLQAGYLLDMPLVPSRTGDSMLYYQGVINSGAEPEQKEKFAPNMNMDTRAIQTTSSRLSGGLSGK